MKKILRFEPAVHIHIIYEHGQFVSKSDMPHIKTSVTRIATMHFLSGTLLIIHPTCKQHETANKKNTWTMLRRSWSHVYMCNFTTPSPYKLRTSHIIILSSPWKDNFVFIHIFPFSHARSASYAKWYTLCCSIDTFASHAPRNRQTHCYR